MVRRPNARSESGFALIEAIVSAAVLAILALAVLSGIDGAQNSSAREKARAVAANLAEQDQERLRGMTVAALMTLPAGTPPVTVDGASYTVTSRAEWVTDDAGGTPGCGNASDNNEYIHITSTVTSSIVGRTIAPVKLDSLVAPSVAYANSHGTLGVKVVNRNGVGIPGITVMPSMSAPPSAPPAAVTDPQGCALFRNIDSGVYAIRLNQAGYVDPAGNQDTTISQKVSPGVVTFKTIDYDVATRATVTVQTLVPGGTATRPSKALTVAATNAQRAGLVRKFPNATAATSLSATQIYPFKTTAYQWFSGNCAYENPTLDGNA